MLRRSRCDVHRARFGGYHSCTFLSLGQLLLLLLMMMMVETQQCSESESRIATGDLTAADASVACCRPALVDLTMLSSSLSDALPSLILSASRTAAACWTSFAAACETAWSNARRMPPVNIVSARCIYHVTAHAKWWTRQPCVPTEKKLDCLRGCLTSFLRRNVVNQFGVKSTVAFSKSTVPV